jgi:hypothetical protein
MIGKFEEENNNNKNIHTTTAIVEKERELSLKMFSFKFFGSCEHALMANDKMTTKMCPLSLFFVVRICVVVLLEAFCGIIKFLASTSEHHHHHHHHHHQHHEIENEWDRRKGMKRIFKWSTLKNIIN